MKKRAVLFLTLFFILQTLTVFAQSNHYDNFMKAYKAKDYKRAQEYIAKLYNPGGDNSDNILYWYGIVSYYNQEYKKSAQLLSQVSQDYNTLTVAPLLGYSLIKINKAKEAIDVLIKTLNDKKGASKRELEGVLFTLIDALVKEKDVKKLLFYQKDFLSYRTVSPQYQAYLPYLKYLIASAYLDEMVVELHNPQNSSKYIENALLVLNQKSPQYDPFLSKGDILLLKKVGDFYQKNKNKAKPYIFKNKVYILKENKGTTTFSNQQISGQVFFDENLLPVYQNGLELFSRFIFYFSRGKILIQNQVQVVDATVIEVKEEPWANEKTGEKTFILQPVFETILHYPSQDILKNKNSFDGFAFLYPFLEGSNPIYNTKSIAYSGPTNPMLVPYTLNLKARRAGATFGIGSSGFYRFAHVMVHEFFHNVEINYQEGIPHVWNPQFKSLWPKWFKGGKEFDYYDAYFRNVVDKAGYQKLYLRQTPDPLTKKDYQDSLDKAKDFNSQDLVGAKKLLEEGFKEYRLENYDKALSLLLKSHKLFPYSDGLNNRIAYIYYRKKKDYKKALIYYLNEVELTNNLDKLANIYDYIADIYEKEQDLASSNLYYQKIYEINPENPRSVSLLARNYFLQKDYQKALLYYEQFLNLSVENHERLGDALRLSLWILTFKEIDYPRATYYFEKHFSFIKNPKDKMQIAYYIGVAYGEIQEYKKAQEYLDLALKLGHTEKQNIQYYKRRYQ